MVARVILLSLLLPATARGGRGVIIAFEAPLYAKQDTGSAVLQTHRQGEIIDIHNRHFWGSPLEWRLPRRALSQLAKKTPSPGFYETMDRNGNRAWIPQEFVKLIYEDGRETRQGISLREDPTDYRRYNPPENDRLPFVRVPGKRLALSLRRGAHPNANYPYGANVQREEFFPALGFELSYSQKARQNWLPDPEERVYWGGLFSYQISTADFTLSDKRRTRESLHSLALGPLASLDVHRSKRFRVNFSAAALLNYQRLNIRQFRKSEYLAKRAFSGASLAVKSTSKVFIKNVLSNLDLFAGAELKITLPVPLSPSSPAKKPELWHSEKWKLPAGASMAVFMGLNTKW